MRSREINVAIDFTATPIGRYRRQGRFSGEAFRQDLLVPALAENDMVTVRMDGTSGLSTGFLDEAFAGLIRERVLTPMEFDTRLLLVRDEDPSVISLIKRYVREAIEKLR